MNVVNEPADAGRLRVDALNGAPWVRYLRPTCMGRAMDGAATCRRIQVRCRQGLTPARSVRKLHLPENARKILAQPQRRTPPPHPPTAAPSPASPTRSAASAATHR